MTIAPPRAEVAEPVKTEVFTADTLDSRGYANDPEGVTGGDVALFLPRLVFTPIRWVLTGVYWPVRGTLELFEEHEVVGHVIDFLYNDERTAAIVPSISLFSKSGITLGATAFHKDLFGHDERISATAKFLGAVVQSYELEFTADHLGGTFLWLETQFRYDKQPDIRFYGLGNPPQVTGSPMNLDPYAANIETHYQQERILGRMRVGTIIDLGVGELRIGGSAIYNHRRFDGAADSAKDRSLAGTYDTNRLLGFADGTDLVEATADLILDLRATHAQTSRGIYLEAFFGGVPPQGQYDYLHWGAEAVGYIDLFHGTRVLALRLAIEAVEGGNDDIPFFALPSLGGAYRLRGHDYDAFRDEKSLLGTLEYHYPIHKILQGVLFFDAGRVSPDYDTLFVGGGPNPWRFGGGGGLILSSAEADILRIDISYGDGLFIFLSTDSLAGSYRRRAEKL